MMLIRTRNGRIVQELFHQDPPTNLTRHLGCFPGRVFFCAEVNSLDKDPNDRNRLLDGRGEKLTRLTARLPVDNPIWRWRPPNAKVLARTPHCCRGVCGRSSSVEDCRRGQGVSTTLYGGVNGVLGCREITGVGEDASIGSIRYPSASVRATGLSTLPECVCRWVPTRG
jgi:hypothetical protein